jgi:hypothetical protein
MGVTIHLYSSEEQDSSLCGGPDQRLIRSGVFGLKSPRAVIPIGVVVVRVNSELEGCGSDFFCLGCNIFGVVIREQLLSIQ